MHFSLPAGFRLRRPDMADALAVSQIFQRADMEEFGEPDYPLDDLIGDWQEVNLQQNGWLITDERDRPVACATLSDQGSGRFEFHGIVDPEWCGRGLGTSLLALAEARTRALEPTVPAGLRAVLRTHVNGFHRPALGLLERNGCKPVRRFWRMEIVADKPPAAPEWPAGLAVREYRPGQDEAVAHALHQECFADHYGFVAEPLEQWLKRTQRKGFDPTLWFLVHDGERPCGFAFCSFYGEAGWIANLGVRRPWRGRGLGELILRQMFHEFGRRGRTRVGLGVDSESLTGAPRLYERVGMRMVREFVRYEKELRPGADPEVRSL